MIIHEPKIEKKGNKVKVSSYIEVEKRKDLSNYLWYEFDKEYEQYLSESLNGFVSSMVLFAMYLNEDIKLKGKISPKLDYGLKEVQNFFNFWNPEKFKKIRIISEGYDIQRTEPKGVMSTFSGGIDSFYTLWKHLPQNEKNPYSQITHCLLINGFADPINDEKNESFKILEKEYENLMKKLNIKLVSVKTNYADFYYEKIPHYFLDGVVLSSIPLLLGKLVSRHYISSTLDYLSNAIWGSNPIVDPMLSTEKTTIIHDGGDIRRLDKTFIVSKWPETYNLLKVCTKGFGINNCCKCEKCFRTMITLYLGGKLSKYKTFPKKLTRKKLKHWILFADYQINFANEIKNYAKKTNREDIVKMIDRVILRRKILTKPLEFLYEISAKLKKKSKTYTKLIKLIKGKKYET
ncbi:hypothetical protein KY334_07215 [Candidatus Woesearchaeota archaeon]|nr:hypothetical protein [Candidatus Woesearchaeota archaeon]